MFSVLSNYILWKKKSKLDFSNILIFDFHLIGDLVLLIPFLRNLRKHFPDSKITLVCGKWGSDIFKGCNYVDEIVYYNAPWASKGDEIVVALINALKIVRYLRQKSFSLGIEIRGDLRQIIMMWLCDVGNIVGYSFTGGKKLLTLDVCDDGKIKHLLAHHVQILEALTNKKLDFSDFYPELFFSGREKIEIQNLRQTQKKRVGIHPFASMELREWPFAKTKQLINEIKKENQVVVFFGPNDLQHIYDVLLEGESDVVVFSGTLREFIVQVAALDCMVAMDSGAAHIASAVGIPVIAIFGPAMDTLCKPIGRKSVVVKLDDTEVPCRPCFQKLCVNPVHKKCLQEISVQSVQHVLDEILATTP